MPAQPDPQMKPRTRLLGMLAVAAVLLITGSVRQQATIDYDRNIDHNLSRQRYVSELLAKRVVPVPTQFPKAPHDREGAPNHVTGYVLYNVEKFGNRGPYYTITIWSAQLIGRQPKPGDTIGYITDRTKVRCGVPPESKIDSTATGIDAMLRYYHGKQVDIEYELVPDRGGDPSLGEVWIQSDCPRTT
jgi:hypothetical protein